MTLGGAVGWPTALYGGYCFFNNAAVAAHHVATTTGAKVTVLDVDYHHGNGTQNAFYEDPTILFFSTHDWQAYPGDNGLAITQVIYDGIEGIVTGEYDDMEELQQELSEEVQDLLPSGS